MTTAFLEDRNIIESYLRRNPYLHLYALGDLDDFFWPYTTWYGLQREGDLEALVLLYTGISLPAFLALSERPEALRELLESVVRFMPDTFYAHFSPGVEEVLRKTHRLDSHGVHHKMALKDPAALGGRDCTKAAPLKRSDLSDLEKLYEQSYPGHWFEPRMMEIHPYYGIREGGELVSVAGVHVYSEKYRVAALGNIATHPDHRGKGLGAAVTAKLCRSLSDKVDHIGLNVRRDNVSAVACYKKLGFEIVAAYEEFMVERP